MRVSKQMNTVVVAGLFALAMMLGCGDKPAADSGSKSNSDGGDESTNRVAQAKVTPAPTDGASSPETDKSATAVSAEPWGDLKMRFVLDGTPPAPTKVKVDKDQAVCTMNHPLDETLVVNQDNNGIADIVVSLYVKSTEQPPAAHPSYAESADDEVYLDNLDCRFEPHVTLLRVGQKLIVRNKDTVGHNTKVDLLSDPGGGFNIQVGPGEQREADVTIAERVPAPVACNAHGWMTGRLVVKDHPYFAKSDKDGNLVIGNLPAGTWEFQIYHAKSGYGKDLDVGGATTDRRGTFEVEIAPGQNDLGEIRVNLARFQD